MSIYDVAKALESPYLSELATRESRETAGEGARKWQSGMVKAFQTDVERGQRQLEEEAKESKKKWGGLGKLLDLGSMLLMPTGMGWLTKGLLKSARKGIEGYKQSSEVQKAAKALPGLAEKYGGTFLERQAQGYDVAKQDIVESLDPTKAGIATAGGGLMSSGLGKMFGVVGEKIGLSKILEDTSKTMEEFETNLSEDEVSKLDEIEAATSEFNFNELDFDIEKGTITANNNPLDINASSEDLLRFAKKKTLELGPELPPTDAEFGVSTDTVGPALDANIPITPPSAVTSPEHQFYSDILSPESVKNLGWKEAFRLKGDEPYDTGLKSLVQEGKLGGRLEEMVAPWRGKTFTDLLTSVEEGDYDKLGIYGQAAQWAMPGMQTTDIAVGPPKSLGLALSPFGNPNWMQSLPRT